MIIGISGKKQSGKDTVGKIIQYLKMQSINTGNTQDFEEFYRYINVKESENKQPNRKLPKDCISGYNYFKIQKFADGVKDIVCLLIGCTREQLEDEEFKNTELGEEWTIWYMTHYKLNNNKIGKIYASLEELKQYEDSDFFQNLSLDGYEVVSERLTPRKLLQLVGTECGREILHPNVWVNSLMNKYKSIGDTLLEGEVRKVREEDLIYPNWIITDIRFPNELKAIEDKGGFVIRVNRFSEEFQMQLHKLRVGRPNNALELATKDQHPSETALDTHDFQYVIDNNGTIEELIGQVKEILIKEKII